MAKRSCDRQVAYSEINVQGPDLVRIMGISASFAPMGAGTRGKFVLSSPRRGGGHMRPEPGAPSSGTPRENQDKFSDGTVWGL